MHAIFVPFHYDHCETIIRVNAKSTTIISEYGWRDTPNFSELIPWITKVKKDKYKYHTYATSQDDKKTSLL